MVKSVEATGKTVDQAIETGLTELGASRNEVSVDVLQEGGGGFLGIIGGKEAMVRLELLPKPQEVISEFVTEIVNGMGISGQAHFTEEIDGYYHFDIEADNPGIIIGRRGNTLDSLQYLVNIAAHRLCNDNVRVVLDTANYRQRREETLIGLAERMARKVIQSGRRAVLEPMVPQDRRVIHLALREYSQVETRSEGEEPYRKVVIERGSD